MEKFTANPHSRQVSTSHAHVHQSTTGTSPSHSIVSADLTSPNHPSIDDILAQELEKIRDMFVPPWRG